MVETILRSAVRVQEYLVQLRAMTSPEGLMEQQKEQVSLEHLAEGWKRTGQSLCGAKQVEFICSSVPPISLWVYPAALDRAVTNLLDNAVRYTPAGGKVVLNILLEEKQVKLSVEDTGPGFQLRPSPRAASPFSPVMPAALRRGIWGWACLAPHRLQNSMVVLFIFQIPRREQKWN